MRTAATFLSIVVVAILALALAGWFRSNSPELLLFSTIGAEPLSDSVWVMAPNGSHLKRIFGAHADESYIFASGYARASPFIVSVHAINASGRSEDHLYVISDTTRARVRTRVTEQNGSEGNGAFSPDFSEVVYALADKSSGSYGLWLTQTKTGLPRQLTRPDEPYSWDSFPLWRPDGKAIIFLRLRRAPSGLSSKLMLVDTETNESTVLLGPDHSIASMCYSPDGKAIAVWGKEGLFIISASGEKLRTVVPNSAVPNREFQGGGIGWSRTEEKLAFALFDPARKRTDIFTVNTNGSNLKLVQSLDSPHLLGLSFIWNRALNPSIPNSSAGL